MANERLSAVTQSHRLHAPPPPSASISFDPHACLKEKKWYFFDVRDPLSDMYLSGTACDIRKSILFFCIKTTRGQFVTWV